MINQSKCAICGSESNAELLFGVSVGEVYSNVVTCQKCGTSFLNPRLDEEEIVRFYGQNYFKDHVKPEVLKVLEQNGFRLLKRLGKYIPDTGNLLDVGASVGSYIASAAKLGWYVEGIEISDYAGKIARENYGLNLFRDFETADFESDYFDLVIMNQLIEHVPDPVGAIMSAFRVLKPGGVIFVSTPNFGSRNAVRMKSAWPSLHPGEHLFFFTAASLSALLEKCGLRILKTDTSQPLITTPHLDKVFGRSGGKLVSGAVNKYLPAAKVFVRHLLGKIMPGDGLEIIAAKKL